MNAREPWRIRAARVRGLALEPLARQLGYRRDPRNRQRWKRPGSVLALAGARFFDHACGRGGGGAIDLVMHAADCSFGAAVEFLENHFGGPAAVREFLRAARGLDPDLLARGRRDGLLYADARRNAVFVCRDPAGRTFTGLAPARARPAAASGCRPACPVPRWSLPPPAWPPRGAKDWNALLEHSRTA